MKNSGLFFVLGLLVIFASPLRAQNTDLKEKTVVTYLESHFSVSTSWWLIEDGVDSLLAKKAAEMIELVNRFKTKIPPTSDLNFFLNRQPTWRFGYLFDDSVFYPTSVNGPVEKSGPGICFVPFHYKNYRPFMAYNQPEQRLIFWAVECPPNILAAIFFDGLYLAAANAPDKNPSQDREALKTAAGILNRASQGMFFNCLDTILARHAETNPLENISVADLKNIDSQVGAENLSLEMAQAILPLYVQALKDRLAMRFYRQRK